MNREQGNWVHYRERFGLSKEDEVDLHLGPRDRRVRYDEVMGDVERLVKERLRDAQQNGRPYLMFIHGWSTSRPGRRRLARSCAASCGQERRHRLL